LHVVRVHAVVGTRVDVVEEIALDALRRPSFRTRLFPVE
jgi:hypothetical protein